MRLHNIISITYILQLMAMMRVRMCELNAVTYFSDLYIYTLLCKKALTRSGQVLLPTVAQDFHIIFGSTAVTVFNHLGMG